jgi:hypothetical protein
MSSTTLPRTAPGDRRNAIKQSLARLRWFICVASGLGFLSLQDINTLPYNYAATTEIGRLLVPQLQQQIEAEHPLGCMLHCGPMYWAEWQAFGVVPWHWAETISICRALQHSMQAEAIQLLSRHDMAQWLLSFRVASRRCRRHALMALMHLVVGMPIAEQLAPAISPCGRLTHRFLLPPAVRITANVLR